MIQADAEQKPMPETTDETCDEQEQPLGAFGAVVLLFVLAVIILGVVGAISADGQQQEQRYVHEDGSPLTEAEVAAFKASPDKYTTYTSKAQASTGRSVSFTAHDVCRAAIGSLMGRDPKMISARGQGIVYLSYTRSDQTRWTYKCRIDGNRVLWGADDGRWRTHPMDSRITYDLNGGILTIRETWSDGSQNVKSYQH